jgi:F0F1-type ATP synthase assembly protein I
VDGARDMELEIPAIPNEAPPERKKVAHGVGPWENRASHPAPAGAEERAPRRTRHVPAALQSVQDKMIPKGQDNVWVQVAKYTSLAFVLPISTMVGYVIGWLLDKLFHTHFLYLIFIVLGVVAGFIELFRGLDAGMRSDGG